MKAFLDFIKQYQLQDQAISVTLKAVMVQTSISTNDLQTVFEEAALIREQIGLICDLSHLESFNLRVCLSPIDPSAPDTLQHPSCLSRDMTEVGGSPMNLLLLQFPSKSVRLHHRVFAERDPDANVRLSIFRNQTL